MCRLSAITARDIPTATKQVIMHFMMTVASADDSQVHGAGVSDGESIFKAGCSYIQTDGLKWLRQLDPTLPWIGHVRKPSSGTSGADSTASHPYGLDNQGHAFVAIHNGWVAGTIGWRKNEPDTDSWRALKALERLTQGALLNHAHIQQWISMFETGSSYSFLFLQDGTLHGIRGQRTLYRARIGDGYMINTSRIVLENVRSLASMLIKGVGLIEEIPEGVYIDPTGRYIPLNLTTRLAQHETEITWKRVRRKETTR